MALGIPCDLSLYSYETGPFVCNDCFEVDRSPHEYWICVSGVKIGYDWTAADPPPPNDWFKSVPIDVCNWFHVGGIWDVELNCGADPASLLIDTRLGLVSFTAESSPPCSRVFVNSVNSPVGVKYYGGSACLVAPLRGGAFSLEEAIFLLQEDADYYNWCFPSVVNNNNIVYKFTRGLGVARIAIVREP